MGPDRWLDTDVWFINKVTYILDRLYFEVSKSNIKSKEYF